jgi:hypothetical protein
MRALTNFPSRRKAQEPGSPFAAQDADGVLPVDSDSGGKVGKDAGLLSLCLDCPVPDGELSSDRSFSFMDNPIVSSGKHIYRS